MFDQAITFRVAADTASSWTSEYSFIQKSRDLSNLGTCIHLSTLTKRKIRAHVLNTKIHLVICGKWIQQSWCGNICQMSDDQFDLTGWSCGSVQLSPPFFFSATSAICRCLLSSTSSLLASLRARSSALSTSTSSKNLCLCGGQHVTSGNFTDSIIYKLEPCYYKP